MNDRLRSLVEAYCNGTLDGNEFAELERTLREDADARKYFSRYMNLDACLHEAAESAEAPATLWQSPLTPIILPKRVRYRGSLAALPIAIAAGLVAAFLTYRMVPPAGVPVGPDNDAIVEATEAQANGIAILTQLMDAEWFEGAVPPKHGAALSAGKFRLKSGLAQIEFFSGATVILQGECELDLVSAGEAICHRGKLRAQVPPAARGFRLRTPTANLVDLGTEFGVAVEMKDGKSQTALHVFDGEVEVQDHRKGEGRYREGSGALLETAAVHAIQPAPKEFLSIADMQSRSTEQSQRRYERWLGYSTKLKSDPRLIAYYAFEEMRDDSRIVPNEALPRDRNCDGGIVGCRKSAGRWPMKKGLELRQPGDRLRIFLPGEYEALTMACWVKVDTLDRLWNALLLTDGYEPGEIHWQFTHEGKLAYSMRVRPEKQFGNYLYRTPPVWTPAQSGRWMHVAVTFSAATGEVTQYVNGREVSCETAKPEVAVKKVRFGAGEIGNWGLPTNPEASFAIRNLNGQLDEFVILSDALSPDEIRTMFDAGNPYGGT